MRSFFLLTAMTPLLPPAAIAFDKGELCVFVCDLEGKGWQDYKFMNPQSGKREDKTSYIVLHDGTFFGCGACK